MAQRRAFDRVKPPTETLVNIYNHIQSKGLLVDVSQGGARVRCDKNYFGIGDEINLAFQLTDPVDQNHKWIIVNGKVIWKQDDDFGLAFEEILPKHQSEIGVFVRKYQAPN